MKNRSVYVVALAVLSLLLIGPIPNSLARSPGAQPVNRAGLPKALEAPGVSTGYATGTVVHADALKAAGNSLLGLDVAFSGAASSSSPLTAEMINEVSRKVAIPAAGKLAFGRGTGLELGIGSEPKALIGKLSEVAAPASTGLIHNVIGPIGIPGIIRAELLRSQAQARAIQDACVTGPEQGYGLGSVLDLEVLGGLIATEARPPTREVVQSSSTTRIVKGTNNPLGLQSETRQTIAPVTFFKGAPFQFTVEVLGEWALRAVADGSAGGSSIHYGPRKSNSPETPIVRILDRNGAVIGQLTTQMLLGSQGLQLAIPGVAEIVVGEDPRAISADPDASSAPTLDPTAAAAAVDVVRVRLLKGQVADVRVGHMEAAVTVPNGGVVCPGIAVTHQLDKPAVTPGEEFTYTITLTNPNDCVLTNVRLVEAPTGQPAGVQYQLVSVTPTGGDLAGGNATFADLGPLEPGKPKVITVKVKVPSGSTAGALRAVATADAVCPAVYQPTTDTGEPAAAIPVHAEKPVEGPTVGVCVVPNLVGKQFAEIAAILARAGCIVGNVTEKDGTPPGQVVDQSKDPGVEVPIGTPIDVDVNGPFCDVVNVVGMAPGAAATALQAEGCDLGDQTEDKTADPEDAGKITHQTPPPGDKVPLGTDVDVTIAGPLCVVPNLVGMNEADARSAVEAQGCTLTTEQQATSNPSDVGKVLAQSPTPNLHVKKGSPVNVSLGVQVLGVTVVKSQQQQGQALSAQQPQQQDAGTAPALVRTGGVVLGGLALWLLFSGLVVQLAGSNRLWALSRRQRG